MAKGFEGGPPLKFDQIRVESSPFVRCIQTASQAASVVGQDTVNISYRVCELLTVLEGSFAEVPDGKVIENLELKTAGTMAISQRALAPSVSVVDTENWYQECCKLYPEDRDAQQRRYKIIADYYKEYPVPAGKNLCMIVATHAGPVSYL